MNPDTSATLAKNITKSSSKQTYYTIKIFVDKDLIPLAYQAYAYFRWVDDILDDDNGNKASRLDFINRQRTLLELCYQGNFPIDLSPEERMLVNLVKSDNQKISGLFSYINNMMTVMEFDSERRGRTISQNELSGYTHALAVAVTDALYHFIGHDSVPTTDHGRYHAVTAAHITHMMRDFQEDIRAGYYNVPHEYLQEHDLNCLQMQSADLRAWVCNQVNLAMEYFKAGHKYLKQGKNLRRKLVGFAYTARFEWILHTIAREKYCLRSNYTERKGFRAGSWIAWKTLVSFLFPRPIIPDWYNKSNQSAFINEV